MKLHLLIFLVFVSFLTKVSGQQGFFRQYTNEQGLRHSYIYTINQDTDGFLWIGTAEGLYKFNGFDFEYFTSEDGLAENFTLEIYRDRSRQLWFGHQNGAVSIKGKEGFEVLYSSIGSSGAVTDFTEDEHGTLWIALQNQGLVHISKERDISPISFPRQDESMSQILSLGTDHFLIGTQEGLYLSKYQRESNAMTILKRVEQYPGSKVMEIIRDSASHYIVVSQTDGFFYIQFNASNSDYKFSVLDDNPDGLLDDLQGGILDGTGSLLLYSMGNGLLSYRKSPSGYFLREENIREENGLASDNIRSLFEDFEGNLWLGMYGEGVLRFYDSKLEFYNYYKESESKQTTAITGFEDKLYTVVGRHLLVIKQSGDSLLNTYPLPARSSEDIVNTAFVTGDGRLWLGLEQSGLYVSNPHEFEFKPVFLSNDNLEKSVNHLTGDGNFLWVATKRGICRIHLEDGENSWFTSDDGLPHNNIQQLLVDSKGRVLVATLCNMIHYIDQEGEVKQLEHSAIGSQNQLVSIKESPDGSIWAGTQGHGVWKINAEEMINYTRTDGLVSDYCYSLALTGKGELLTGHRGGISVIRPESRRIRTFGQLEGITNSTEFFPNATWKDPSGNIWLGTSQGTLRYDSHSSGGGETAPRIHIDGVYIDGERIDHQAGLNILKPGQYQLRIDYVGLNFSNPEMVEYQTKLEGYTTDWSASTDDRQVVYERIGHGLYSFHIRAYNENDFMSELATAFEIRINKPIYQRIWFYGIILLALGLIFYSILRIRERNHRMVQERLLKNLDEKTKEIIVKEEIIKERKKVEKVLIEAKTKAEQSEKLKTSFLQNISHEIRTPMNAIVGFTQLLKEDEISIEDRNTFIEHVSNNTKSLLDLVDNIIELSQLETGQLELTFVSIRVNSVINDLEEAVLDRLQKKGKKDISLHKVCPGEESFEIVADFARLKQVFSHLLDNAVKFTEKGEITYGYQVEEKGILFFVEDTGIGLSEDKKDVVFDLFRKVEEDRFKLYGGTGLGLTLAKYLVNMLGGEIGVDSKQGEGSRFYFNLPFRSRQVPANDLKIQSDES